MHCIHCCRETVFKLPIVLLSAGCKLHSPKQTISYNLSYGITSRRQVWLSRSSLRHLFLPLLSFQYTFWTSFNRSAENKYGRRFFTSSHYLTLCCKRIWTCFCYVLLPCNAVCFVRRIASMQLLLIEISTLQVYITCRCLSATFPYLPQ